jgi:hypothetical protein
MECEGYNVKKLMEARVGRCLHNVKVNVLVQEYKT